jgi:hypothetical protein
MPRRFPPPWCCLLQHARAIVRIALKLEFGRTTLRRIVLITGLAASIVTPAEAQRRVYRYDEGSPYSYRPEYTYRAPYYGDAYRSRWCLPEEDGHLSPWTCEYRN